MTVLLLANVGNRDLTENGGFLNRPRSDGARLKKEWPECADRIQAPILRPLVDYVRRVAGRLDEVVLYATDQSSQPAVKPEHLESDTLHFAELARLLLERQDQEKPISPPKIRVRLITGRNPSLYDEMLDFFQGDLAGRSRGPGVTSVYVALVGGTPAANLGLIFGAVACFDDRCTALYLRHGATVAQRLDLPTQLRVGTLRKVALRQVADYRFAAAGATLRELREPPVALVQLAEYAQGRLNFDFGAAWREASEGVSVARAEARQHLERAMEETDRLLSIRDERALLGELGHNLRVAYQTGAYLSFLSCVVRLEEAAARLVVERFLAPLSYAHDDLPAQATRRAAIEANADLHQYLTSTKEHGPELRYWQSNTTVLLVCFDYLLADRPNRLPAHTPDPTELPALRCVHVILRRIEKRINRLRNKSVLTHGYGGMSKAMLEQAYSNEGTEPLSLPDDLALVVRTLAPEVADRWHVDEVRAFLMRELGEAGQL